MHFDDAHLWSIYIGVAGERMKECADWGRSRGMRVFQLKFDGIKTQERLEHYLMDQFEYPYPAKGLDAAADLMSDLEWIGSDAGYLFIATGVHGGILAVRLYVSLLPQIADRFRSGGVPFLATVDGNDESVVSTPQECYREFLAYEARGFSRDTHPVEFFDLGRIPGGIGGAGGAV